MNIKDWMKSIHKLAVEKGWWEDETVDGMLDRDKVKDVVPTKLLLITGEVSEAAEEARCEHWVTYWDLSPGWGLLTLERVLGMIDQAYAGGTDETARLRLGQLIIYLGLQDDVPKPVFEMPKWDLRNLLLKRLCEKHKPEGFGIEVVDGIIRSLDLLHALDYDVEELMMLKHEYNKTRPYRHGNKRF